MFFFKKKQPTSKDSPEQHERELKSVTENLYKQNLELVVKNKTLSLLRQLYQISILTLKPKDLGREIVTITREALEFELVGILVFDGENKKLAPLAFATSERLHTAESESGCFFETYTVLNPEKSAFLNPIINTQSPHHEDGIADAWKEHISAETLGVFIKKAYIKTTLGYPLTVGGEVIGVLIFFSNRKFSGLAQYEKESMAIFADVIAVALDKARLYEQLGITNSELTEANKRLRELDQMKSEFLSFATHQLRSPLTAIKGYASLILEGSFGTVSETVHGAVDKIFQSSQALVGVVEDFLNISRIEQGRMKYDFSTVDLKRVAEEVIDEQMPAIKQHKLATAFAVDEREDYSVRADFGKIKQVVGNIIDNAIKYTPQGSITVTLARNDANHTITLAVADTGLGITKDALPMLFEKFERARNARQTNVSGTGLGLYLAKEIMKAHRGHVWAESQGEGKGSTFYLEFKTNVIIGS